MKSQSKDLDSKHYFKGLAMCHYCLNDLCQSGKVCESKPLTIAERYELSIAMQQSKPIVLVDGENGMRRIGGNDWVFEPEKMKCQ